MKYNIDQNGYYGEFGGAYIPEMLVPNIEDLRQNYLKIMAQPSFKKEFDQLLNTIVRSIENAKTLIIQELRKSTIP